MINHEDIGRIAAAARAIQPSKGLSGMSANGIEAGQIWLVAQAAGADEEPAMVLVLDAAPMEGDDSETLGLVPLHRDCAMAGPEDVILPREIFGHRVVVCVGASLPALHESLDEYVGQLPTEWFERIRKFADWLSGVTDERPLGLLTGLPYLDEQDMRWRYKEAMAADLAYLQAPVVDWVERSGLLGEMQEQNEAPEGSMGRLLYASFGGLTEELALAADSSKTAERSLASRRFRAVDRDLLIQVSQSEDPRYLSLEVLRDPQNLTEGGVLFSENGDELGRIANNTAYFIVPKTDCFALRLADGRDVEFQDVSSDGVGEEASDDGLGP